MADKLQGHLDSPLTDLGKRQAQWLSEHLIDIELDAIYSSASPRAMHTAEIIRDMGTWEGKGRSDLEREYRDEYYKFWNEPHAFIPTNGGEDFVQLQDRLISQVNQIISKHNGGNVLMVTHAVALKVIMAYFKGDPLE